MAKSWQVYDNSEVERRPVAFGAGNDVIGVEDAETWRRLEASAQWRETTMTWEAASRMTTIMLDGTIVPDAAHRAVREALLDRGARKPPAS